MGRAPQDPLAATRGRADLSPDLDALAERVARLRPNHRDYEHFHIEKDEIARELLRLAQLRW